MPQEISRAAYAAMFGPTTGDKLRLADTDLIIEVERDLTAEAAGGNAPMYGEEVKFGGGKVIRDGMGQSQVTRADGLVGDDPWPGSRVISAQKANTGRRKRKR